MSDELRDQINDIIEGEIQNGINDYIEQQGKGFKGQELKVNVSQDEIDKIIKEYKKLILIFLHCKEKYWISRLKNFHKQLVV